jgi:hypothetical protein
MSVVTTYSTATANSKATPRVQNPAGLERGRLHRSQGYAVIANGDSVGSVYPICRIRSNDFPDRLRIVAPDIGTTTAADVGLYKIASDGTLGAVKDADFFASAVVLNAGAIDSDITFEAGAAGGDPLKGEKRVWEAAGDTTDPAEEYFVCLTLTGAADAAGNVLLRVYVCNGD